MPKKTPKSPLRKGLFPQKHKILIRISYGVFVFLFSICALGALFVIETKESVYKLAFTDTTSTPQSTLQTKFPIGVNPQTKSITEDPTVDFFLATQLGGTIKNASKIGWLQKNIVSKLAQLDWYQNLASPVSRILVAQPGERKEEIVDNFGDILHWDTQERAQFAKLVASSSPSLSEGKFFPSKYVVQKDTSPEVVAEVMVTKFNNEIASRYTKEIETVVPLNDALTIASLLEKEAYDFEDMRYISGVIWNRLFVGMHLQLDASLQYAKANQGGEKWWPVPVPADKYITSPFNTYKNGGLPPAPIANTGSEAILAALNPKVTDCMFYFHDKDANFHCTKTYEEHVALLKQYYGRGK